MLLRFCWIFIGCFLSMQVHAEEKSPEHSFDTQSHGIVSHEPLKMAYRAHERVSICISKSSIQKWLQRN